MSTELWLYGSTARGTNDERSDLDLLVASADDGPTPPEITRALSSLEGRRDAAIKRYSWRELEAMAQYGSLFLLHLHLEARPVIGDGRRLKQLLSDLPMYSRSREDLAGFRLALDDAGESLADGGDPTFEAIVIATTLRHASILCSYLAGQPTFGRDSAIRVAFGVVGMQQLAEPACALYDVRLTHARGAGDGTRVGWKTAEVWLEHAVSFLDRIEAMAA
jgi:hypothetical protein